jgi:hypothetical protein
VAVVIGVSLGGTRVAVGGAAVALGSGVGSAAVAEHADIRSKKRLRTTISLIGPYHRNHLIIAWSNISAK